ncbi:MAG: haloacid dehalogenase [Acidimicrobiaceae bacterium]|jgi:phosphoglycolate phosphatase|nr:haloacid dehalogenase [Acidimicrobiaceae bacterium]
MTPSAVLFDLDGTLTDSAPGIVASVEHALEVIGLLSPGAEQLRRFVGPPMQESFRGVLGLDEPGTERAMRAYREYFTARGMFDNSLFPGIAEMLEGLDGAGTPIALATSKPTVFAEQILEHFGIRRHFVAVCGADLGGQRAGKTEIVGDALRALPGGSSELAVMVGDREHDVLGAAANGVDCLGVAWGYAAPGELAKAGALRVVASVEELHAALSGT